MSRTTLFGAVFLAVVAVVGLPGPAYAHAALLSTTPPAGTSVPESPDSVTLTFSEPVSVGHRSVALTGTAGPRILVDPPRRADDGRSVQLRLRTPLPDGTYTVHWQVTASDGDLVEGSFQFAVGASTTAPRVGPAETDADGGTVGLGWAVPLRWLLFGALAAVAGGLAGERLARRHQAEAPVPAPRPWLWQSALAGLVAVLGLATRLVVTSGGSSPGGAGASGGGASGGGVAGLRDADFGLLTGGTAGRLLLAEAVAFAVVLAAALALRRMVAGGPAAVTVAGGPDGPTEPDRPPATDEVGPDRVAAAAARATCWIGVAAVAAAEGLRGHPREDAGAVGVVTTAVHVLAAAVWVGSLAQVVRVGYAWRARRGQGWLLAWDYARLAAVLFGVVAVTGAVAAVVVLPSAHALVGSGYGRTLIAKLALVAVVGVLALLARRRFRRAPAPDAGVPPGGPARVEVGALVAVLGVTALLVSLAPAGPPAPVSAAPALPPRLVGPSVSLGTLVGQVTVGLTAATGQVRVQLYAPDPDPRDEANQTAFAVAATVADRPVVLRACGGGCFIGRVDWPNGVSRLQVHVTARPWHAGTAVFDVPWPPRLDTQAVPAAVAAVRTAGHLTVHERVTSDAGGPPGSGAVTGVPGQGVVPEGGPGAVPGGVPGGVSGGGGVAGSGGTDDVFAVTAQQFLSSEPYGSGNAPPAAVLGRHGTSTELAFAYLAEGVYVRLVVGPDRRVEREWIAAPNELVTRTFDYR